MHRRETGREADTLTDLPRSRLIDLFSWSSFGAVNAFQRVAKIVNRVVIPLLHAPLIGRRMSETVAIISYTGRRSGRIIRTPVNYRQHDDSTIAIGVMAPDKKTWWRNFYPDPAPITIDIAGTEHSGIALAHRDDSGAVNVELALDAK